MADDAVRMNLDRKFKVDNIRSRVDEVIARSQAEVARSVHVGGPRVFHHDYPSVEKIDRVARKTVASYSPIRTDPIIERRVAWGGPPAYEATTAASYAEMKKQYSFGREPFQPGVPPEEWAREREFREQAVRQSSPFRDTGRAKSGGKVVKFL